MQKTPSLQEKYGFKAQEFHAKGFADKEEYKKVHGSDLFLVDLEEYDRICKVRSRSCFKGDPESASPIGILQLNHRHALKESLWRCQEMMCSLLSAGGAVQSGAFGY